MINLKLVTIDNPDRNHIRVLVVDDGMILYSELWLRYDGSWMGSIFDIDNFSPWNQAEWHRFNTHPDTIFTIEEF